MSKEQNQEQIQIEQDWAYKVFDSFIEAFNKVSSSKEEVRTVMMNRLKAEFVRKLPELFEALTIIVGNEHHPIIYSFFKSLLGVLKFWSKKN